MIHPYIGLTEEEIKSMLQEMGLESVDRLFEDIPSRYLLKKIPEYSRSIPEWEVRRHVKNILGKNKVLFYGRLFIGGGVWPHVVPSIVRELLKRSEFYSSYTPYQPEVSQGVLQALFEYQSLMAELLDIEVVNASMYDWGTALGEAFRMAKRVTGRSRVLYPHYISPERLEIAKTYTEPFGIELEEYAQKIQDGSIDVGNLEEKIGDDVAAVYVEYPSYLGFISLNIKKAGEIAHSHGALFIVGVDPTILGVFQSPGKLGADIVVGEGQPLGLLMNFGGPLLGIMGCRMDLKLVHQLPGRLIGMTNTIRGERAFTMILQAREQHIKREKATSNICTNQALCAIASAIYLSLLGKSGFRKLGEQILARTRYMIEQLSKIRSVEAPLFKTIHFKEFTFRVEGKNASRVILQMLDKGVVAGICVGGWFKELGDSILTCTTEVHSKEDIDFYVRSLREVLEQ